ncbi:MAG: hypothetical protein V2I45_13335, partial [Halieaceae bacterium]|nr:hypothetical protein [Halieaceae bacterium]
LSLLCKPQIDPYFFEHSLGQLTENIKAYRLLQAPPAGEQCTLLTLCRDPFDWFRSAIGQEIEGHMSSLSYSLSSAGVHVDPENQADIVQRGLELLMLRITQALQHVNTLDDLTVEVRRSLDQHLNFPDTKSFEDFLFLLGRFLQPHFWFASQFQPVMGFGLNDLESVSDGLWRFATDRQDAYLLRYESMPHAYHSLMETLAIDAPPELERANIGEEKPFAEAIQTAFSTTVAQTLKELSTSNASRCLGYS